MGKICFVILSLAVSNLAFATVHVQQIHNPKIDTLQILNVENTPKTIPKTINGMATHSQVLRSFPLYVDEDTGASSEIYEELLFEDQYLPTLYKNYMDQTNSVDPELQRESEVRTLVLQGPTKNRINLTILGDGYTTNEKQKFFDDAQRITDDLFKAKTFSSYLPLFNVFAVFLPSQDSG
ncbi:MAG: hypothetical protein HY843_06740, partial [Bdellovibrio sp.]|nr:hypothetical protein [Bdellovibrio sp.]